MTLSNFNTRIFSTLVIVNVSISFLVFAGNDNARNTYLSFFKTKLVSHSIKVRSHYNFLKLFLIYLVKIMEGHVNFRCAIQVSYVAVRHWLEILINEFLIKKLSMSGGEWCWIYFGWWWVVVGDGGYILASGGWWWVVVDIFWLVVGGGGWWWIYFGWWWVVVDGGGSWWIVVA